MGYLQIGAAPITSFKKAVISLWFRIPAAALSAVQGLPDHTGGEVGDGWGNSFHPALYKIIPLITFGSIETTLSESSVGGGLSCSPSFIGINCNFGDSVLCVNLQTPNTCSFVKPPEHPESELRPECFFMSGRGSRPNGSEAQTLMVTPDVWHHALISFDLAPSCSVTWANANRSPPDPAYTIAPGPTFSWAFDDVDKTGTSLIPSGGGGNFGIVSPAPLIADNYILPQGMFTITTADDLTADPLDASTDFTIRLGSSIIASSGQPIGIPTSAAFVDNVYNIDMAYLQFFTEVSAAAGSETLRRAFIKSDRTPETDYSIADELLGKSPSIRLHGNKNWKAGRNSGTGPSLIPIGTIDTFGTAPRL